MDASGRLRDEHGRFTANLPGLTTSRTCGTISKYHSGCKCEACRRAARLARRRAPSRLRTDLPVACREPDCSATFRTEKARSNHARLHAREAG